jgi:hypothetical protein
MAAAAAVADGRRRRRCHYAPAAALLMLLMLAAAPALLAAPALAAKLPAAAPKKTPATTSSKTSTPTPTPTPTGNPHAARAARRDARLGDAIPTDPSMVPNDVEAQWAVKSWEKFAAAFPRFIGNISEALQRGRELARQPIPAKPTDPIVGDCVPFKPPAPYRSVQQYAKAISTMPWQEAERMFRAGKTYKGGIGIRGCAGGVIVGDNMFASLGRNTPLGDSWSGKCIDEDPVTEMPFSLTNAIAPFVVNNRDWRTQRVPGDKLWEARVSLGKSYLDGQAAWVLDYNVPGAKMHYGFDFRDIRDEVRMVEPGFGIGAVYGLPSNDTYTSAFNPSNTTLILLHFALFQTCASDGNYPTQPIDRVYA